MDLLRLRAPTSSLLYRLSLTQLLCSLLAHNSSTSFHFYTMTSLLLHLLPPRAVNLYLPAALPDEYACSGFDPSLATGKTVLQYFAVF